MLYVPITAWKKLKQCFLDEQHISFTDAGERVRNVISKPQVRTVAARPKTAALPRHERRLIESRLQGRHPLQPAVCITGMVGFYQRGRQATTWSISSTCYPAQLVHRQLPRAVSTGCWHWLTSSRTYSTTLAMFCINFYQTKLIIPIISDLVVTLYR